MQIYDTDSDEVGLNILTDVRYRADDIQAVAKLIVSDPQGTAVYTILDAGAKEPVTKMLPGQLLPTADRNGEWGSPPFANPPFFPHHQPSLWRVYMLSLSNIYIL